MLLRTKYLLRELKERKIIQALFYYLIGGIGVLASVYDISSAEKVRRITLILCISGLPITLIASHFHGKGGRNSIPIKEILLISICVFFGGGLAVKAFMEPKPITILIRMMEPQESWFVKNVLSEFEKENGCRVILKRFRTDHELVKILEQQDRGRSRL